MLRRMAMLATVALVGAAAALPAQAGHTRVFLGFGAPIYAPPPVYYAPPPVYYYPPPPAVVYTPPPAVAYAPAPTAGGPSSAAEPQCREYRGDATIDSNNQPFYGTACLQADGQWHIVN